MAIEETHEQKADHYRETIIEAIRFHHRHGVNDSIFDALHIELADLSFNTLEAIAKALDPTNEAEEAA